MSAPKFEQRLLLITKKVLDDAVTVGGRLTADDADYIFTEIGEEIAQTDHPLTMHPATFDYIPATYEMQKRMETVRAAVKALADCINEAVPEGPDKTYVMRQLRTVGMWANIAITKNPDGSPRED